MENIEETVLNLHTKLMYEQGIKQQSSPELELRPRNGITSSTIVSLILDIEDVLNIQLDNYIYEIRKCKTISDFILIIETAFSDFRGA
ncbi:MAG: hypothetical protein J6K22_06805 [Spirochaetaceae bacterium]|nr:hypothetical protein [Spirochaetaceae bacterium]